ncbi:hypothetical protein ACXZ7E_19060 [Paenibacillus lautus]
MKKVQVHWMRVRAWVDKVPHLDLSLAWALELPEIQSLCRLASEPDGRICPVTSSARPYTTRLGRRQTGNVSQFGGNAALIVILLFWRH